MEHTQIKAVFQRSKPSGKPWRGNRAHSVKSNVSKEQTELKTLKGKWSTLRNKQYFKGANRGENREGTGRSMMVMGWYVLQISYYYCNGKVNQQWEIVKDTTAGTHKFSSTFNNLCWDDWDAQDGQTLRQYDCVTGTQLNQQFRCVKHLASTPCHIAIRSQYYVKPLSRSQHYVKSLSRRQYDVQPLKRIQYYFKPLVEASTTLTLSRSQ